MVAERVRFPALGAQPPMLEGALWLPGGADPVAGVVVAHPHPLRGGSMDNNVVYALGQGLQAAGIAWLRFNFRGVGQSQGRHGEGVDEVDDVLGALAFLAAQPRVAPENMGLAGYSFGARVSLSVVPQAPQIRALLCVAPPLQEPLLPERWPACPFLVMVGEHDHVLGRDPDRYAGYFSDSGRLQVVPGTDHFWRGLEPVLVDAAHQFFADALPVPAPNVSTAPA